MSGLRAKASTFDHPKAPHATVIAERHFTAALEIVLPVEEASLDAARAADVLCDALRGDDAGGAGDARGVAASDAPDFYAAELSLADILDEGFLAAHVRAPGAKLYAVNADGRADRDDVTAVTPTGRLLLSLTPETYRRAGVSGAPSDDGTLKRRCAVNLANKTFSPGTPFRDRLVACARAMDAEGERRGVGTYLCAHTVDDVPTPMLFPAGRPHAPRAVFATAARAARARRRRRRGDSPRVRRRHGRRARRRGGARGVLRLVGGAHARAERRRGRRRGCAWGGRRGRGREGRVRGDAAVGGAADARARRCRARVLSTDRARWEGAVGGAHDVGFRG